MELFTTYMSWVQARFPYIYRNYDTIQHNTASFPQLKFLNKFSKNNTTYVAICLANEVFDNTYKVLMTCKQKTFTTYYPKLSSLSELS